MTRLVALYNGSAPQQYTFFESAHADRFDAVVHQRDLDRVEIPPGAALLVPSRMHLGLLADHRATLRGVLEDGGHLLLFGKRPEGLLPEIRFASRPTNFWWWLDPEGDSGLRFPRTDHPFFDAVPPEDCKWHFHGVFDAPTGADVLIEAADGGAVLFLDGSSYPGTLLATSLDPIYHHGSRFMPATDRFLGGFLPWVRSKLLETGDRAARRAPSRI